MSAKFIVIQRSNRQAVEAFYQGDFHTARNNFVQMLSQLKEIQKSLDDESFCGNENDEQNQNEDMISKRFGSTSVSNRDSTQNLDELYSCDHKLKGEQINQMRSNATSTYYVRSNHLVESEYFSSAFLLPDPHEGERKHSTELYIQIYTSIILYNFGYMYHILGENIGSIVPHKIALRFYMMSNQIIPELDSMDLFLTGLVLRLGAALQCNTINIQRKTFFDVNGSEELIQNLVNILGIWRSVEVSCCTDILFFMRQLFLLQASSPFSIAPAA